MKVIDGVKYYSCSEVAMLVGRSESTIRKWDKYSYILQEQGKRRLIPAPKRMNDYTIRDIKTGEPKKCPGKRLWSEEQVKKIIKFCKTLKKGVMTPYNRTQWGERGREIQERREKKRKELIEQWDLESLAEKRKRQEIQRFKWLKKQARQESKAKTGKTGSRTKK